MLPIGLIFKELEDTLHRAGNKGRMRVYFALAPMAID